MNDRHHIIEYAREHAGISLSIEDFHRRLAEVYLLDVLDIPAHTVRGRLSELVTDGILVRTSRGRYALPKPTAKKKSGK